MELRKRYDPADLKASCRMQAMLPQSIELRRMIGEIGLLIDYISGRGTRTFLAKPTPDYSGRMADKLGEDPTWEFFEDLLGTCSRRQRRAAFSDPLILAARSA